MLTIILLSVSLFLIYFWLSNVREEQKKTNELLTEILKKLETKK